MRFFLLRGVIMSERIIMDEAAIQRTVTRIAHEILEYNKGTEQLAVSYTHLTLPTILLV